MKRQKNYEIRWDSEKKHWKVKREGASRPGRVFDTKKKAIKYGKRRAKEEEVSVLTYTRDGRHQETDTYKTTDKEAPNR